jgi:hypothetical protein
MLSEGVGGLLALGKVRSVLGVDCLSSVDKGICDEEATDAGDFPGHSNLILGLRVSTSKTP